MWVEPLQLDPRVFGCELPIGLCMMFVSMVLPSGDLSFEGLLVGNAAAQTLAGQDGEFGLGQVEPASMFGSVMPFEPVDQATRFGSGEGGVE